VLLAATASPPATVPSCRKHFQLFKRSAHACGGIHLACTVRMHSSSRHCSWLSFAQHLALNACIPALESASPWSTQICALSPSVCTKVFFSLHQAIDFESTIAWLSKPVFRSFIAVSKRILLLKVAILPTYGLMHALVSALIDRMFVAEAVLSRP